VAGLPFAESFQGILWKTRWRACDKIVRPMNNRCQSFLSGAEVGGSGAINSAK